MPRRIKSLARKFSFRFAVIFLATMLVISYVVRENIVEQFTSEYDRQLNLTVHSVQGYLKTRHDLLKQNLKQIANKILDDNEFRLHALVLNDVYNPYLIDYAGVFMPAMGLQALEITNGQGIVLSSGHARNTFGKNIRPIIDQLLKMNSSYGLTWFEENGNPFLCLTALESVKVGSEWFFILGGVQVTRDFLKNLQPHSATLILLQLPHFGISSYPEKLDNLLDSLAYSNDHEAAMAKFESRYSVGEFNLPYVLNNSVNDATFYLLQPRTALLQLLGDLNQRIYLIGGVGLLLVIVLSIWLVRSITKPLRKLAITAANLSMDDLHAKFEFNGDDEVGVLNDVMVDMLKRLRLSRMKLASAERKAAQTEIARQVNHDIKNGFIPIRNVMRHWQEVAETQSEKLSEVFNERKETIWESLNYLEELTRYYSRIRPEIETKAISINYVIRHLVETYSSLPDNKIAYEMDLEKSQPHVQADELQLRRAFENILMNAIEAINETGRIAVTTQVENGNVIVTWEDNGVGVPEEVLQQLFRPHVTTKEKGTGLGLANVKRIMEDFGGSVAIESQLGKGTRVKMILPRIKTEELKENS